MPPINVLYQIADPSALTTAPVNGQGLRWDAGAGKWVPSPFGPGWLAADLVADRAAVADWGPVLNAAVAAGKKCLVFGPYDFPFSTPLNFDSTAHVNLVGPGGGNSVWSSGIDVPQYPGRLIWKGTGSGVALSASAAVSFAVRGLQVCYDNPLFTGTLVSCVNNNWGATFAGAALTSTAKTIQTAAALLSLDNTAYAVVDKSVIAGGRYGITGAALGAGYANANVYRDSPFSFCAKAFVTNTFQGHTIDNCTFEVGDCERVVTMTGPAKVTQLTLSNCWVGDVTGSATPSDPTWTGRPLFENRAGDTWSLTAHGNRVFTPSGPIFLLPGGGRVVLRDNFLQPNDQGPVLDLGDTSAGATPKLQVVYDNDGVCITEAVLNRAGHRNVRIAGAAGAGVLPLTPVWGHSRNEYPDRVPAPTIAAGAALGTGGSVNVVGNDSAGIVLLASGTGTAAGVAATVTFGKAMVPAPGGPAAAGGYALPLVALTPCGGQRLGITGDAAALVGASVYVPTAMENTGFQVRFANAPASTTNYMFHYRTGHN
jgi:hypothetical protein